MSFNGLAFNLNVRVGNIFWIDSDYTELYRDWGLILRRCQNFVDCGVLGQGSMMIDADRESPILYGW